MADNPGNKDARPSYKLIGQNYLPDLVAKVTGRAKYADDFRAEGMLFAIGDDYLRRTPATPSMILTSIDAGKRVDEGLVTHV